MLDQQLTKTFQTGLRRSLDDLDHDAMSDLSKKCGWNTRVNRWSLLSWTHLRLPFSACLLVQTVAATFCLVDALFQVFYICVIGKQHLEDCEWNGVRSGNTVVCFWSFSKFWCGIEEWFFCFAVSPWELIQPCFFLGIIEQFFYFSEGSPLTVATSPVGSAACTCTSQSRGCGP